MENSYIRMDLAMIDGLKGTLKLTGTSLEFRSRKGESFSIDLTGLTKVAYRKTAMTTSLLYIENREITVCRAHLWAGDIGNITGITPEAL